jgi:hypothetical protein
METPEARRPSRAAVPKPKYRAVETLVYPANEDDARQRLEGERYPIPWAKANPGDPVPDWLVALSPGQLKKGRVELIPDGEGE